ncbi:MAG: 3-oxoacyl-[acyl-carrier-protein] synthase III C-terminal domain-containing protein [Pseudomonadota bacterium]
MRPRLLALQTAVPPFALDQDDIATRASHLYQNRGDVERLLPVFLNAGIDRRYSCVPIDWYADTHGWRDRTDVYLASAQDLLEKVAEQLIAEAGLARDDIDAIVAVSTTGIATPSLDALIVERMQLRRDIKRLPIFGLGCAGGVVGLARAADLAMATPGSKVMLLVIELCALSFRRDDFTKSNIVATALFGDGAAGAILSTDGDGPEIGVGGEHTWPHSLDIMGWDVEEDGLKALFSQSIPGLVSTEFRAVLDAFLRRSELNLSDFDSFACHPGGAKVLDALEAALDLPAGALKESRQILREYGNMSAVTALFVLQRILQQGQAQRILMSTLGPGFTAAFLTLNAR